MMTLVTLPQKAIVAVIVMKASTVALKTKTIFCVTMKSVLEIMLLFASGRSKRTKFTLWVKSSLNPALTLSSCILREWFLSKRPSGPVKITLSANGVSK